MGIHDREYYRDERMPGIHLGGQRMMVTNLVILNIGFFLLNLLLSSRANPDWLTMAMAVSPEALVSPWLWWRFLTSGFAHSPQDIRHILFNMAGLWFLGREVERVLGRVEFLRFYLVSIVLGSLLWALREYFFVDPPQHGVLLGASGGVTAVIMLFVFYFPKRMLLLMFVIPVPAWVVGVLIIVLNVFGAGGQVETQGGSRIAYDVHLVGAAFAGGYYFFRWNLGRLTPSGQWKKLRPRPRLKVHDPDPDVRYQKLDDEADRILDKVHREGEASLTPRERRILEDYSRRMRQKHR